MQGYQGLSWKTRGGASPQGRPRIYFCCHPDDFARLFEPLSDELLDIQRDASVWYYDPAEGIPGSQEFLEDLAQMQLFVVPVTSSFLYGESQARSKELPLAFEGHIPVLPLMQGMRPDQGYEQVFGDLQCLDREATEADPTAIPYVERLRTYLSAVLVGDELAARVRAAFDAYVFLSYRKRDRAAAQRVMRLIHEDPLCRSVAIWYDEFLVPGEGFNQAILDALQHCSVFALVVTPNLLEHSNYVLTTEWPRARDAGKPVLPVEVEQTDAAELARLYVGLGETIPEADRAAVAERFSGLLRGVALAANADDPAHNYLVGLAYLMGIDVEVDHPRAVSLITSAAEAGLIEALERLVAMHNTGEGVERDYHKAIGWQERLVEVLRERARDEAKGSADLRLGKALCDLGDYRMAVWAPFRKTNGGGTSKASSPSARSCSRDVACPATRALSGMRKSCWPSLGSRGKKSSQVTRTWLQAEAERSLSGYLLLIRRRVVIVVEAGLPATGDSLELILGELVPLLLGGGRQAGGPRAPHLQQRHPRTQHGRYSRLRDGSAARGAALRLRLGVWTFRSRQDVVDESASTVCLACACACVQRHRCVLGPVVVRPACA